MGTNQVHTGISQGRMLVLLQSILLHEREESESRAYVTDDNVYGERNWLQPRREVLRAFVRSG